MRSARFSLMVFAIVVGGGAIASARSAMCRGRALLREPTPLTVALSH